MNENEIYKWNWFKRRNVKGDNEQKGNQERETVVSSGNQNDYIDISSIFLKFRPNLGAKTHYEMGWNSFNIENIPKMSNFFEMMEREEVSKLLFE